MRITIILAGLVLFFAACKKDKYTTEPQIKFKSFDPDFASSDLTSINKDLAPKVILEITDDEGDIGLIKNKDTAKIYVKNLHTSAIDSFDFPNLESMTNKRFKGDIVVNLFKTLECLSGPPARPRTDTFYYEIYVTDFAKHKSNVIVTDRPVYYRCL